jgi:hypothetical protein
MQMGLVLDVSGGIVGTRWAARQSFAMRWGIEKVARCAAAWFRKL